MLQFGRDVFRSHEASTDHTLDDEITKNTDDVGPRAVSASHDVAEFGDPVERRPHMKVGQDRDSERTACGPAQADSLLFQREARGLEPKHR